MLFLVSTSKCDAQCYSDNLYELLIEAQRTGAHTLHSAQVALPFPQDNVKRDEETTSSTMKPETPSKYRQTWRFEMGQMSEENGVENLEENWDNDIYFTIGRGQGAIEKRLVCRFVAIEDFVWAILQHPAQINFINIHVESKNHIRNGEGDGDGDDDGHL